MGKLHIVILWKVPESRTTRTRRDETKPSNLFCASESPSCTLCSAREAYRVSAGNEGLYFYSPSCICFCPHRAQARPCEYGLQLLLQRPSTALASRFPKDRENEVNVTYLESKLGRGIYAEKMLGSRMVRFLAIGHVKNVYFKDEAQIRQERELSPQVRRLSVLEMWNPYYIMLA